MICDKRFKDKDYPTIATEHGYSWTPDLPEDDYRKSFEVEYLELRDRYKTEHLLLPVLLSDACSLLFSDRAYEREFMVRMWCLLKEYLHRNKDDPSSPFIIRDDEDYPLKFTGRGGPVPIRIPLNSNDGDAVYRTGSANPSRGTGNRYTWTDDEYRFVILGLRAIGTQPQYHVESNRKCNHAHNHSRKSKTCGELLPSIFLGQETPLQFFCWDKNDFGCTRCDAHTMIFTYIALAEHKQLGYGGLGRGTIKPSLVPNLLETLDTARYKYEDFWILIARKHSQCPGSADGNAWGMFKLERLDFIRYHSGEGVFWNQSRFGRVTKELAAFRKERKRNLANGNRVKKEPSLNRDEDDGQIKRETSGSVIDEDDIEESDDYIFEIPKPSSSRQSINNAHTNSSTKPKTEKRAIKFEDTDSDDDTKIVKRSRKVKKIRVRKEVDQE